jgi:hypothetical protein
MHVCVCVCVYVCMYVFTDRHSYKYILAENFLGRDCTSHDSEGAQFLAEGLARNTTLSSLDISGELYVCVFKYVCMYW